jgi:hypothetical protein
MTTESNAAASRRIPGSAASFAMSTPSGVVTTGVPFRVQIQNCFIVPAFLCLSGSDTEKRHGPPETLNVI